jgi:hypothetical protein
MPNDTSKRKAWLLLFVVALASVFVHALQHNWTLHARLNLLLRGYVFYHLEPPDHVENLPVSQRSEVISKLVYSRNTCVGYLNPYGTFVQLGNAHSWDSLQSNALTTTVILFYLEIALIVAASSIVLSLAWYYYRERKKIGQPRGVHP